MGRKKKNVVEARSRGQPGAAEKLLMIIYLQDKQPQQEKRRRTKGQADGAGMQADERTNGQAGRRTRQTLFLSRPVATRQPPTTPRATVAVVVVVVKIIVLRQRTTAGAPARV